MKTIALLTVLAMATSTAAFAQPPVRADRDDAQRAFDRDHDRDAHWNRDPYARYNRSHWAKDFRGRWLSLGSYNARTDVQTIRVDGRRYSKLRIEGRQGQPAIQKISIQFADRTVQTVDLGMRLTAGAGEVIDLNGNNRRISQIVVWSEPRTRGSFTMYGA